MRILRNRVLRIVNDEIGLRKEIDVTLVLLVPRWITLGSCRRVRGMWLVIHRVHNRIASGLQVIAQRESWVVEILRGDAHFTNREFSLRDIVKANRRYHLRQRDRKVVVLHLARQWSPHLSLDFFSGPPAHGNRPCDCQSPTSEMKLRRPIRPSL